METHLLPDFSVEHYLGITRQPPETCPLNHEIHHGLSVAHNMIKDSLNELDSEQECLYIDIPKKKAIKQLISIISQMERWKEDWYTLYLRTYPNQSDELSKEITELYHECSMSLSSLELELKLKQARNSAKRFVSIHQVAINKIKNGYKTLRDWETRLSDCEPEEEAECESAIELSQDYIEVAARDYERECEALIEPISECMEILGPSLQQEIEILRSVTQSMREKIKASFSLNDELSEIVRFKPTENLLHKSKDVTDTSESLFVSTPERAVVIAQRALTPCVEKAARKGILASDLVASLSFLARIHNVKNVVFFESHSEALKNGKVSMYSTQTESIIQLLD